MKQIITIGREFGAGGGELGRRLARELGIAYYDRDIILRTAHALPDQVMAMFADEFATNDVWKHFRAVKEGRVYDLPYDQFGMSATFNYPDALQTLQPMLYGEEG